MSKVGIWFNPIQRLSDRFEEWIDERINPIILQDIRYYASNRLFTYAFVLSLVIGGFSSFFVINGGSQEVYLTLFGMAIVSMMLIVPAQVLYSSSRWS